jgi:hypothetical protein
MPSYSIFAMGTFESLKSERSIISQFYYACTGSKLILDGLDDIFNFKTIENNVTTGVKSIVAWLETQNSSKKYTINLAGYSRGAVTCTRIANRLYRYLQENQICDKHHKVIPSSSLQLNIFGIDPVAGIFEKREQEGRDIPPIVNDYTALLQMHEYRKDFVPQDLSRVHVLNVNKTQVTFHPMYGYHCLGTKKMDEKLSHTTEIHWQLFYRFLIKYGTPLSEIPAIPDAFDKSRAATRVLNDRELLNLFAIAKQHKTDYEAASETGFSLSGQGQRSFMNHLDDYVEEPAFFINQAERDLFKTCFPNVFVYFFEKGIQRDFYSHEVVFSELKDLLTSAPIVFQSLACKGVTKDEHDNIHFPLRPKNGIEMDQDRSRELVNDIMLELYLYRRAKSEWMAFSVGNEYDRTCKIEKAIKEIKDLYLSPGEKKKRILDVVQEHYFDLYQSNSANKLFCLLENVLYRHGRTYAKDIYNANWLQKAGRTVGAGGKQLGELIKNAGRAVAFAVGAPGSFLDGLGNCFMYNRIPVLYHLGKLISLLGRGIKLLATWVVSPCLEFFGDTTRGIGKRLVKFSGVFPAPILREPVLKINRAAMNKTQSSHLQTHSALRSLFPNRTAAIDFDEKADVSSLPVKMPLIENGINMVPSHIPVLTGKMLRIN